jgi:hypothetical protein
MMFFARWSTGLAARAGVAVGVVVETGGVAAQPVSAASSAPAVKRMGRMQSSLGKAGSLHCVDDGVVDCYVRVLYNAGTHHAPGLNSQFFQAASTAFGYFGLPRLPL